MAMMTYRIEDDGQAIRCLACGLVSRHPEDIRRRYCGRCHVFHEACFGHRRPTVTTLWMIDNEIVWATDDTYRDN